MHGDPGELARWLANRTGPAWTPSRSGSGGVAERVYTGLVCTSIELQPVGRQILAAADRIAHIAAGSLAQHLPTHLR
jgi:streptomycin 6-kinase